MSETPSVLAGCDKCRKQHEEEVKKLTAEKFCKKCGCKMSLWCEKDVKERMDAKNSELQAENEKLTDAIESLNVDLSAAQEELKAKEEQNKWLEAELKTKDRYIQLNRKDKDNG